MFFVAIITPSLQSKFSKREPFLYYRSFSVAIALFCQSAFEILMRTGAGYMDSLAGWFSLLATFFNKRLMTRSLLNEIKNLLSTLNGYHYRWQKRVYHSIRLNQAIALKSAVANSFLQISFLFMMLASITLS